MAPSGNGKSGNTRRISPSKKWCFTLNNYTNDEWLQILEVLKEKGKYIIGKEVGEQGTPHIQGYVEFHTKCRPLECIKNKRIHWEKAKGNQEDNIKYCSKDGKYETNLKIKKELKDFIKIRNNKLYYWQEEIKELLKTEPDERSIYWYWEPNGCEGKTALLRHICITLDKEFGTRSICVSGKSADIKLSIEKMEEKPDVVIFICPRYMEDYFSYGALEEVKDAIFFSGKYESGMCIYNPPHVIVLANFEPEINNLSKDRWKIHRIKNK